MTRISWSRSSPKRGIVESYDTGVTLRQLFYRLVAAQLLPNTRSYYQRLSATRPRVAGRHVPRPARPHEPIEVPLSFAGLDEARLFPGHVPEGPDRRAGMDDRARRREGRHLRTARRLVRRPFGIPHVALGGYVSQTLVGEVRHDIRPATGPRCSSMPGTMTRPARTSTATSSSGSDLRQGDPHRVNAEQLAEYGIPQNVLDPEVADKLGRDPRCRGSANGTATSTSTNSTRSTRTCSGTCTGTRSVVLGPGAVRGRVHRRGRGPGDPDRASMNGRVPPHNLEAEESLIGAMMLSREALTVAVEAHIEGRDFYKPGARRHLRRRLPAPQPGRTRRPGHRL